ncbi:hypothetical protein LRQ11_02585 [Pseudomonas sp. MAFF 311095]|uniref:hypothetical protein n=1 Tax=Pseudomonas petroselini TaxID=2899822 RepID=UPI0020B1E180|nr:hypothetical protein [Pseudomonas petroselini]MCD7077864.1 hypothetical protein [Pseudomonas petroselini]
MAIGAIDRAMGMVNGQNSLDQGGAKGPEEPKAKGGVDQELLKKLMAMLGGQWGCQGSGGSSGSGGSEGSGGEMDPEQLRKMMSGRQGMEAMMPDSDNGRKVGG